MILLSFDFISKDPIFKYGYIQRYRGLGLNRWIFRET